MDKQVLREHYFNPSYLNSNRFIGLGVQVRACIAVGLENSFLEIGLGPGMLATILKSWGAQMHTMDFDPDLKPDIVGALPDIPFADQSIDVICAFEVLEHLPLEKLGTIFAEFRRVARKKVLVTVPSQKHLAASQLVVSLKIGEKSLRKTIFRQRLRSLTNPKEHYWELDYAGVQPALIGDLALKSGLKMIISQLHDPWYHLFEFDVA